MHIAYYRYLNAHGKGTTSTVFLFVVAILDAGRNSLSFFLLLVVSLGLSVIREDLGSTMRKCQILAGFHFVFGGSSPLWHSWHPKTDRVSQCYMPWALLSSNLSRHQLWCSYSSLSLSHSRSAVSLCGPCTRSTVQSRLV